MINCFKFNPLTMNPEHLLKLFKLLLFLCKLPDWSQLAIFPASSYNLFLLCREVVKFEWF